MDNWSNFSYQMCYKKSRMKMIDKDNKTFVELKAELCIPHVVKDFRVNNAIVETAGRTRGHAVLSFVGEQEDFILYCIVCSTVRQTSFFWYF